MGKLLLPDFAMTKSSLPQTNLRDRKCSRNSNMGALWFSNYSQYSHHLSISEPPIYKLILALYYSSMNIIEKLTAIVVVSFANRRNIPYTYFSHVNSTDKDQRNYLINLRTRLLKIMAARLFEIGIILPIICPLLFRNYCGSNYFTLILLGLMFAFSYFAERERIGANLCVIINK